MSGNIGEYYLGLDMGTNSVGWAVTDPEYNILEYQRKPMWGVHLFKEGQTAKERRTYRCARRRLNRRKQRITLLRELFSEEICKVDPSFFERLDESSLHLDDRNSKQRNTLFNDENFKDKDFHNKFPTAYHLRKFLMETKKKPDIRWVYLAAHHIIKYRGHFLFGDHESDTGGMDFGSMLSDTIQSLSVFDMDLLPDRFDDVANLLCDTNVGLKEKKKEMIELLGCNEPNEKEAAALICGSKAKLDILFNDESLKDTSVSFADSSIEDTLTELEDVLDEDAMIALRQCRQLYMWSVLRNILGEYSSISEAKVASYNKHQSDLKLLKKAVREYIPEKYSAIFRSPSSSNSNNYVSYVGSSSRGKPAKTCTQDVFCKNILDMLKETGIDVDPEYSTMLDELKNYTFLPKQTTKENSLFPHTEHYKELKKIIENVTPFYPFLSEVGDDGFTVGEKILMVQEFRIPYYVGPISTRCTGNHWSVRKSSGKVTPWNFKEKIDVDASAENFIQNLTNYCTYLVSEKVLPKNSILYSRYQLYNELNNLKINGEKISVPLKKDMIKDIFLKTDKQIRESDLKKYLVSKCLLDPKDKPEFTGVDFPFKSTLRSERRMVAVLGDKSSDIRLCESIIRTLTIFNDRKIIERKLRLNHGDILSKDEIKTLSKINYEGWGRLSEKLLTGLYCDPDVMGQKMNIISLMEGTQDNFMEVFHKYGFNEMVEKINLKQTDDSDVSYEILDKLNLSPAVRRSVWRTVRIVQDIVDSVGHMPSKVFVETTRQKLDPKSKVRKDSRRSNLIGLYKACKEDPAFLNSLESKTEIDLKSRRLYLYYCQLGKCMYCGNNLDVDQLDNTQLADLDHIFPQSKIKDDSIHNNLVLVCKGCNQKKGNIYPVSSAVQAKMRPFWEQLRSKKYITPEKYSRLIRNTPFSDEELAKFINRQLVETSQSVKGAISVLKRIFGNDTDIVYVKGGLVSEFRQKMDDSEKNRMFLKCRSINDVHHAKDAYLNIVVGNVYDTKFTKNAINFIRSKESYNVARMYDSEVYRDGKIAWSPGDEGTIKVISKYMRRDNILFTRQVYNAKGGFFDELILKKGLGQYRIKEEKAIDKYGGYNKVSGSHYVIAEYILKGEKVLSLESVPILKAKMGDDAILSYISENIGADCSDLKIIVPSLGYNTLIESDGLRMMLGGRTGNYIRFISGYQLLVPDDVYRYSRKLYNFAEDRSNRVIHPLEYYGINRDKNIEFFNAIVDKASRMPYCNLFKTLLPNLKESQKSFEEANAATQARSLVGILPALQPSPTLGSAKCKSDDKHDVDGKKIGIIERSKIISRWGTDFTIIYQSPSGLHEYRRRII